MDWSISGSTMWINGWKNTQTVETFVGRLDNRRRFVIYPRYNKKGVIKDFLAYYKDSKTDQGGNNFGLKVKGNPFSSSSIAMRRCDEIAEIISRNEDVSNYFTGSGYIDSDCPTAEQDF